MNTQNEDNETEDQIAEDFYENDNFEDQEESKSPS